LILYLTKISPVKKLYYIFHILYLRLVGRFTTSMQGKFPFPHMDWRFNEFPNEGTHALYSTCVEIMGLPVSDPAQVGAALVDVIIEANHLFSIQDLPDWINSIGLLLSYLPDVFLEGLTRRLTSAMNSPPLSQWNLPQSPFNIFNFDYVHRVSGPTLPSR
jgi:mediator of RNA polymerase II transcription subunit 23